MARKKEMAAEPTQEVVIAYKGFDPNWQCRGYQYKVGDTFKHDGDVQACSSGFHACEFPLDVLGYYAPVDDRGALNRFALVECTGTLSRHGDDSKIAAAQLTVKAEIKIPELISYAVKWILDRADSTKAANKERSLATNTGYYSAATNTGDYSAATNTGNRSAATNTGDYSAATNTGDYSAATNTGDYSAATNTGNRSAATNTGDYSAATNTGYYSAATNTGYYSAATNTGNRSAATNTGNRSAATNTGDYSAATNTGNRSAATNTGYYSAATNTGYYSAATNTGDYSAATNTGYYSAATAEGKHSVAGSFGYQGKAKAAAGCAIFLVYRNEGYEILHARGGVAGRDVKADTWYSLDANGEFMEVK